MAGLVTAKRRWRAELFWVMRRKRKGKNQTSFPWQQTDLFPLAVDSLTELYFGEVEELFLA